jgi:methylene-tetrahydrofolate reductase-like protein
MSEAKPSGYARPEVEPRVGIAERDASRSTLLERIEHAVKGPVFGCQMCGQCVLHSTGLTCPMNCPKTLRNGPCGGVRPDGTCEVRPEMRCVWLKAYERSRRLPLWKDHFGHLRPPVDNSLKGTSSWRNLVTGRDRQTPPGWDVPA